jgi:CBS domain-containing protein
MGGLLVRDIMQHKIVTVSAGDRLSTVEDIMTLGGVRHMPVVSAGNLVGVVSERDLLRASLSDLSGESGSDQRRAFLHGVEIVSVMSAPAVTIGPDAEIREAARAMAEQKIGCLPVVEPPGELIGIVTETDLLRFFAGLGPDSG